MGTPDRRRQLYLPMVLLCLAAVLAAAGPGWAADILFSTFVNTQSNGIARDATFDKSGNLYIAGGGAGFERADLTFDYKTERGGDSRGRFYPYDVFVQKYGAHGRLLWTVRLGGEGYDRAYALEIDRQGNILVAGRAGAGPGAKVRHRRSPKPKARCLPPPPARSKKCCARR